MMPDNPKDAAIAVLGWYDIDGYAKPGSFVHDLILCMIRADRDNLTRLALGFPHLAEAVHHAKTDSLEYGTDNWDKWLRETADGP